MDNNNNPQKPSSKRRRARRPDGQFRGNNPETETNEAWEPVDVADVVTPKGVKYEIKPKIGGPSNPTAGKYGKKPKVNPTFGNVTSTSH